MLNPNEGSQGTSIPAFIGKLWHMVSDSTSNDLIQWGKDGKTFLIKDHNKFSSKILPKYYKHDNMASFIRQLNMYDFHKVVLIQSSSLKNHKELEFSHPQFVKGQPQFLCNIQRKIHNKDQSDIVKCDPVVFNSLLKEVKQLRLIQELFSNKLTTMKKENAALWREHSILRQRHAKQEKIVNKVIHFLISMVQQSSVNVARRKAPLMIKDRPILKPTHHKNCVRVINQKNQPVIRELSNEVNDGRQAEEVELPEALLLAYDPQESDTQAAGHNQEVPLLQVKAEESEWKNRKGTAKSMKIGKKRKHEETLPSGNVMLPDQKESTITPTSSFAENAPSPEFIFIENAEDFAQLLRDGEVGTSINGMYYQDTANTQNFYPNHQVKISGDSLEPVTVPSDNEQNQGVNYVMDSSPTPIITSPAQSIPSPPPSITTVASTSDSYNAQQITPLGPTLLQLAKPVDIHQNIKNKEDAENHLDKVQSDLEILKGLLKGESISLDANMVLELFNDNPIDLNMGPAGQTSPNPIFQDPSSSGQELISYSPSLLDLENEFPVDIEDLGIINDGTVPDCPLNTPHAGTQSPNFPET